MIFILLAILSPISFGLGWFICNNRWTSELSKGTGKMGIIRMSGTLRAHTIEVEELQVAGNLTKVRVEKVIKQPNEYKSDKELLSNFNEWVKTSQIIWYDNNTQLIRKKRLDKLLGR